MQKLLSEIAIIKNMCYHVKYRLSIDDYAKDGGPEEVYLLCSFYHEPLSTLEIN